MGDGDSGTESRFMVEIGSQRFDPRAEAARSRRRATSDRKRLAAALDLPPATLRAEPELWIVQFAADPDLGTIRRCRDDYGLRLSAGLSALTFVELMTQATAARVRRESAVRACIPYWSDLKLARSSLAPPAETAGERLLRLGIVGAVTASLTRRLALLGFDPVGPETPGPGGAMLRVKGRGGRDPRDLLLLNEVEWVEDVRRFVATNASSSAVAQGGGGTGGARPVWDKGLHGEGQIVGVFDTDVPDLAHDFFRDPAVPRPGPTHRKVLAVRSRAGGPGFHATRVSGCAVGDDVKAPGTHPDRGGAWAAKMVYTDIDPLPADEDIDAELRASAALGARVHNMSAGVPTPDGTKPAPYAADAVAFDSELWRNEQLLLVAGVPNTPPCLHQPFFGAPASAKNPVMVAGTRDVPRQDTFHTGLPGTADGRRKPDLVAVGEDVRTSEPTTPTDSAVFGSSCGTSYAAPHVAAAAALVRQYFVEGWYPNGKKEGKSREVVPSGALLKAMLLNATVPMAGASYPSVREGWGRLQLDRTLHFDGDKLVLWVQDVPHLWGFDRTGAKTFLLRVPDNAKSMKVTLVYNDPPGAVGAKDPVVNHLDVVVMEPMRTRFDGWEVGYFGNDFTTAKVTRRRFLQTGQTRFPPDPTELKNNVRQVVVDSPAAGRWGVAVFSYRFDRANTPAESRRGRHAQGYAVVACVQLN